MKIAPQFGQQTAFQHSQNKQATVLKPVGDTVSFSKKSPQFSATPKKAGRLTALTAGVITLLSACGGNPSQDLQEHFLNCFGPEAETTITQSTDLNCDPIQAIDEQLVDALEKTNKKEIAEMLEFVHTQPKHLVSDENKLRYGIWAFDGAPQDNRIEDAGLKILQSLLDSPDVSDTIKERIITLKEQAPFILHWDSLRWQEGHESSYEEWVREDCWYEDIEEYNSETGSWEYAGTEEVCEDVYETVYEWNPGYFYTDQWTTREYPNGYPDAVADLYDAVNPRPEGRR